MIKFPDKKYNIIYADPAWDWWTGWDKTYGNRRKVSYQTLSLDEIKNLPVIDIAADNAKLFMLTINKYLPDCFDVVKSWGFNYSTTLIWIKKPKGCGVGGTFAINAEYLIFATKGKQNALKKHTRCWFEHPRSHHSKKPNMFRELIESTYHPDEAKIELFARERFLGWDAWGNEV